MFFEKETVYALLKYKFVYYYDRNTTIAIVQETPKTHRTYKHIIICEKNKNIYILYIYLLTRF